jgi:diphthamide biosynthesis protein 3
MADDEQVSIYDEIEIEDMTFDPNLQIYHYPCPCGDRFEIGIADLRDGEEIAVCPSCSLMIRVIFEQVESYTPRPVLSLLWRDLIGFAVLMGVCLCRMIFRRRRRRKKRTIKAQCRSRFRRERMRSGAMEKKRKRGFRKRQRNLSRR